MTRPNATALPGIPHHEATRSRRDLLARAGAAFGPVITAMGEYGAPLLASKRQWSRCGQSGLWMSDWVPHHHEIADEIAVIRSCWTDGINHAGGVCQMNTGVTIAGRPSLGSWVT